MEKVKKVKKVTKEELEKATKVSQEYNGIIQAIGNLELQKQDFLLKASEIRSNIEDMKKELQESYGNVNIDLVTGEYEENAEDKKD
tara:strand:+ start:244 stop:501 length:258 start_codon:yes stop_codon:yes gene_type:complete